MKCNITIDEKSFSYDLDGSFTWGNSEVLFDDFEYIINQAAWKDQGYGIIDILDQADHLKMVNAIKRALVSIAKNSVGVDLEETDLSDYHKKISHEQHLKIVHNTRFIQFSDIDMDIERLCDQVSDELKVRASTNNSKLSKDFVTLRISRPRSLDINPPHRDGYLEVYENTINLWIPIVGCTRESSLPVMAASHLINESNVYRTQVKGATINSVSYHVPGIVDTKDGMKFIRPNPMPGQALIFTPFLIHGSAINEQPDITRMSLEIRLAVEP